jgi:CIC family chloride channel protein
LLPVKMLGGMLALGSGLALGREGPTVQIGGAIGDLVARLLDATTRERLTLIAAGAGAGLAAAFNAPLSGLVFVLEEVQRDFRRGVFGAAFIASAIATVIAQLALGQMPVFTVPHYPAPPLATLPAFAVLGVVTGLLGVAFNRGLLVTLNFFAIIQQHSALALAAAIGALVGLISWFSPQAVGSGHALAEIVLVGQVSLAMLPLWFLLRFGLTLVSYGTSAPGGIFAPLLVLGALIGLGIGHIAHWLAPLAVPEAGVFAVVGMAAYFAAIVRAPLTGIVLIMEMTGDYDQMLPLLISCFCAYAVAEWLRDLPIYEALLERDLLRAGLHSSFQEPRVVEMEVEPGSPFAGQQLRTLGLPIGCLVVRCCLDEKEWIPTADTFLAGHMRITAVIAPEATNALATLRYGCAAPEQ